MSNQKESSETGCSVWLISLSSSKIWTMIYLDIITRSDYWPFVLISGVLSSLILT